MPLLRRKDGTPRLRVLTAAARQLDLENKLEAKQIRALRQGWQADAWNYRDSITELRYAIQFKANALSRMRLYVAVEGEEDEAPTKLEDSNIPEQFHAIAHQALADLAPSAGQRRELLKSLSTNIDVAGECFTHGQKNAETGEETWHIRSLDELVLKDDGVELRQIPDGPQGIVPWEKLNPELNVIFRVWVPHARFALLGDSPLRSMLQEDESLLLMRRMIRAEARSRTSRGLLLIPDELSLKVPTDDNEDPEADPFFSALTRALMEPIGDEGVASAVAPIVVRGQAEMLDKVRLLDLGKPFEEEASRIREELVGNIATGFDLPKEIITGMMDANHWTAWQIDDNTFRHHLEPHTITCCDSLTAGYFRERIIADGVPPEYAQRMVIWYDPTELVTHPDQTKDALDLYDRHALSVEALAKVANFTEADLPRPEETALRLLQNMRTPPANLVMAVVHQMFPTLTIPPITTAGSVPGVKPSGVDPGEAPESALGAEAPPVAVDSAPPATQPALEPGAPASPPVLASGGQADLDALFAKAEGGYGDMWVNDNAKKVIYSFGDWEGELAEAAFPLVEAEYPGYKVEGEAESGDPRTRTSDDGRDTVEAEDAADWRQIYAKGEKVDELHPGVTASARPRTAQHDRLSRRLVQIDRDLRARLQIAANAAMLKQLERVGARLRQRVAKDETLRTKIAHRRNERVSAVLGPDAVRAAGVDAEALVGEDWSTLRGQFYEWTTAAQAHALATAQQLAGLEEDDPRVDQAQQQLEHGRDRAWETLAATLSALGAHLLYNPDPNVGPTDWADLNPNTLVQTGTIRAALGIAGGGDTGVDGAGNAIATLGEPIGQIGTGTTIRELLESAALTTESYEWEHGPSLKPFEPHLALDGITFASFADESLANTEGFPGNQFFFPGDHDGCTCDVTPLWVAEASEGGEE